MYIVRSFFFYAGFRIFILIHGMTTSAISIKPSSSAENRGLPFTLLPLKRVLRSSLPFTFFPRLQDQDLLNSIKYFSLPLISKETTRDNGITKFFQPIYDTVVIVRLINTRNNKSFFALAEYCINDVWVLSRLDPSIKGKEIKELSSISSSSSTILSASTSFSLYQLIESCKTQLTETQRVNENSNSAQQKMNPSVKSGTTKVLEIGSNPKLALITKKASNLHTSSNCKSLDGFDSYPSKRVQSLQSMLVSKYYENLYKGKTPVSYFAKSTLSRARAMSKEKYSATDNTLQQRILYIEKLLPYLEEMVLDIIDLDAKYDPKNFYHAVSSESNSVAYSIEEQRYMKLWFSILEETVPNLTFISPEFIDGIETLKTREVQMQIILLLEILALEHHKDLKLGKQKKETKKSAATSFIQNRSDGKSLVRLSKKAKLRKKKEELEKPEKPRLNTEVLATAMFDILCIRNLSNIDSSSLIPHLGSKSLFGNPAQETAAADKTQEFCREAVMPFYSSKLPDLCKKFVQSCRGNSTGMSRRKQSSTVNIRMKSSQNLYEASRSSSSLSTNSLASFRDSQGFSSLKASRLSSFRGGLNSVVLPKEDRRQVEMTFSTASSFSQESNIMETDQRSFFRESFRLPSFAASQKRSSILPDDNKLENKQVMHKTNALTSRHNKSGLVRVKNPVQSVVAFRGSQILAIDTLESRKVVEVAGTPVKRKRQLRPSSRPSESPEKRQSQLVLVDGHIYSDGEEGFNNEDVILETPMKKKRKNSISRPQSMNRIMFESSTNLNVPKLTAPYEEEEEEIISSSPIMKTPRHNETRSFVIPDSNLTTPTIRAIKSDIYDENSPNFMFPSRDQSNVKNALLSPSPIMKKASKAFTTTTIPKTRKSQQWFDNEFPTTRSQL